MFKILVLISVLVTIIVMIVAVIVIRRKSQKQDFDMTPRDRDGNPLDSDDDNSDDDDLDDFDDDNNPASAPVYEDDVTYDDWQSWEDFLQEIGVIDIRDGMIEYETGDNSRMFVMLSEMQQSNPYLKTDAELKQQNAIQEVFYNGLMYPLKETSQSQRVEMTDFINRLREHSQYLRGTNRQMKAYAEQVLDDTLNYQRQTDRFENRAYLQFLAIIRPDEVYGDSPEVLEEQIHQKAAEKLLRQIDRANGLLKRADHALAALDTFGLLEVIYKTFNRESSVKMRLEDIVKHQRYSIFTSTKQTDKIFKMVQQRIHIETQAINNAREILIQQQNAQNAKLLANGKDYYQDTYDENDDVDQAGNAIENDDLIEGFDPSSLEDLH